MKYKLINHTKISRDTLNEIISFVCPKNLKNFIITINNKTTSFEGYAVCEEKKVIVRIKDKLKFPTSVLPRYARPFGYIDNSFLKNKKEVLVNLISHELRHLWQDNISKRDFFCHKSIKMFWPPSKKTFNINFKAEKDASQYSRKMLLKWRKQQK